MKKLTTRWYYSLLDIVELYGNDSSDDSSEELPIDVPPTNGLAEFCGIIAGIEGAISEDSPWGNIDDEMNQQMWAEYLWPEFKEATILYVDQLVNPWELNDQVPPTRDEVWKVLKPLLPRYVRWLQDSSARYETLITAYQSIAANLLAKVETVSTGSDNGSSYGSTQVSGSNTHGSDTNSLELHNDTPQSGGDFTTDPYVSDATKRSGSELTTDNSSNHTSSSISNESSSSTTVSSDMETPIERLNELRKKLHNLWADWADEFERFVILAD